MLCVAVAASRLVHMGEVGTRSGRGLVIEELVEAGEREPAPQHSEQQDGSPASHQPLRHGHMIPLTNVLGPEALWLAAHSSPVGDYEGQGVTRS
jgi:hypothetical protein